MVENLRAMMAHNLIKMNVRQHLEKPKMKFLGVLILIAIHLSMLGCSTMAHIMQSNYATQSGDHWIEGAGADNRRIADTAISAMKCL